MLICHSAAHWIIFWNNGMVLQNIVAEHLQQGNLPDFNVFIWLWHSEANSCKSRLIIMSLQLLFTMVGICGYSHCSFPVWLCSNQKRNLSLHMWTDYSNSLSFFFEDWKSFFRRTFLPPTEHVRECHLWNFNPWNYFINCLMFLYVSWLLSIWYVELAMLHS